MDEQRDGVRGGVRTAAPAVRRWLSGSARFRHRRTVTRVVVLIVATLGVVVLDLMAVRSAAAVGPWADHGTGSGGHDPLAVAATRPGPAAASADQPVTAADRDLLIKVRLAGLWEMPAGRMAVEKGVSPRVREVGQMILSQHGQLDALVVQAAREVGVAVPDEPEEDQKGWLREMEEADGAQFDYVFVDRLRAAHGKVFPAIANVRAGTRNDVVRQLTVEANGYVGTHLSLLESTGLVDYTRLPVPPAPPTTGNEPGPADLLRAVGWVADAPPWLIVPLVPITVLIVLPPLLRLAARHRPSRAKPREVSRASPRAYRPPPRPRIPSFTAMEEDYPPRPEREPPPAPSTARRLRANPPIRH